MNHKTSKQGKRGAANRLVVLTLTLLILFGVCGVDAARTVPAEQQPADLFKMAAPQVVYSTVKQDIYLRSGPGFSYPVLKVISACTELKVLSRGIWYCVEEGDTVGYVYGGTFNAQASYIPGRLKGIVVGLDPDGQVVMDNSTEPIAPGSQETAAKMQERIFGVNSGTMDYQVNGSVVILLKRMLELEGATVILTKTDPEINLSNSQRALLLSDDALGTKCNLVIRLSCAHAETDGIRGVEAMIATKASQKQATFAQQVIGVIAQQTGLPLGTVKRVSQDPFLNWCTVPAVTIDMGYLSNALDEKILVDVQYQATIADSIRDAVVDTYGLDG